MKAFYDFSVSPYSYDFVTFLMCAKSFGADEIVFVPGKRMVEVDGEMREFQKCSPEEQEYRMKNLLLPLVDKYHICKTREEARDLWSADCFPFGYTVDKPVEAHQFGHLFRLKKMYPIKADKRLVAEARRIGIDDETVVITMRENGINPGRNSNTVAWIEAAKWMQSKGLNPVFIPDTENPNRKYGAFHTVPRGALSLKFRLAMYQAAMLNVGINTGPLSLCTYSRRPLLFFKPINPCSWATSAEYWASMGLAPGSQFPWFTPLQRIVWEPEDDFETITKNIQTWLDVRAGRSDWPLSIVPKFPVVGTSADGKRVENMETAVKKGISWFKPVDKFHDETISIVCYGPSLKYTWKDIKHPMMTVSGAHDFMIKNGVIPDYHMDCDPRPHKAKFTENPRQGVKYLMASCCNPKHWENLEGQHVELWHMHNGPDKETAEWLEKNVPQDQWVGGGTTAGLRALDLCGRMGYRKFEVYGMDCSFESPTVQHAGEHNGKPHSAMKVRTRGGREFITSPQMIDAARWVEEMLSKYDIEITFNGDGLLQQMVRDKLDIEREAA